MNVKRAFFALFLLLWLESCSTGPAVSLQSSPEQSTRANRPLHVLEITRFSCNDFKARSIIHAERQ